MADPTYKARKTKQKMKRAAKTGNSGQYWEVGEILPSGSPDLDVFSKLKKD